MQSSTECQLHDMQPTFNTHISFSCTQARLGPSHDPAPCLLPVFMTQQVWTAATHSGLCPTQRQAAATAAVPPAAWAHTAALPQLLRHRRRRRRCRCRRLPCLLPCLTPWTWGCSSCAQVWVKVWEKEWLVKKDKAWRGLSMYGSERGPGLLLQPAATVTDSGTSRSSGGDDEAIKLCAAP